MCGGSGRYRDVLDPGSHVTGLVGVHLGQVLDIEHRYSLADSALAYFE